MSVREAEVEEVGARRGAAAPARSGRGAAAFVLEPGVHQILTPEGVPLVFGIASVGERLAAFLWDLLLLAGLNLALVVVVSVAVRDARWIEAFALVAFFLSRTFYFAWFEIRWQGVTPGKRKLGLRVIDAGGGPLRPDAVLARNFMREIELMLPLAILLAPELRGSGGVLALVSAIWVLLLPLLPLFTPARVRVGDVVAGTRVVKAPKAVLLRDLAAPAKGESRADLAFTREQLEIYGIYELQVLEDLLRKSGSPATGEALDAVAAQIQKKIGWAPPAAPVPSLRFLESFYAAQRARLEQKLLFGQRQERKRDAKSS